MSDVQGPWWVTPDEQDAPSVETLRREAEAEAVLLRAIGPFGQKPR